VIRLKRWAFTRRLLCRLGWHEWRVHQVAMRAEDTEPMYFILAWRQCRRCAESRLVHILADDGDSGEAGDDGTECTAGAE